MAREMNKYWANFAKTGNPNGSGLPHWPRITADGNQLMNFHPARPQGGNRSLENTAESRRSHPALIGSRTPSLVANVERQSRNDSCIIGARNFLHAFSEGGGTDLGYHIVVHQNLPAWGH